MNNGMSEQTDAFLWWFHKTYFLTSFCRVARVGVGVISVRGMGDHIDRRFICFTFFSLIHNANDFPPELAWRPVVLVAAVAARRRRRRICRVGRRLSRLVVVVVVVVAPSGIHVV